MARMRGRKRKSGGHRQPDGRRAKLSHQARAEALSVGLSARMRVHGLSKQNATRQEASDWLGRMHLKQDFGGNPIITARQLEAYGLWVKVVAGYLRALDKRRERSASDLNCSPGYDARQGDEDGYVERCARAVDAYDRAKAVIVSCGDKYAWNTLQAVYEGAEMPNWISTLHTVLDALAVFYRLPNDTVADALDKIQRKSA
jgi:hypothetical protein